MPGAYDHKQVIEDPKHVAERARDAAPASCDDDVRSACPRAFVDGRALPSSLASSHTPGNPGMPASSPH